MGTKLGQSFQLSKVRNKSELLQGLANCRIKEPPYRGLQKYVHYANKFANVQGAHTIRAIVGVSQLSAGDLLWHL